MLVQCKASNTHSLTLRLVTSREGPLVAGWSSEDERNVDKFNQLLHHCNWAGLLDELKANWIKATELPCVSGMGTWQLV